MSLHARTSPDRKQLAREFLELANDQYQQHRLHRVYYARIAREHGLTNQDIADAYGVTETAIRSLLKRAKPAEPVNCGHCRDSVKPGHICPICGLYDPSEAV